MNYKVMYNVSNSRFKRKGLNLNLQEYISIKAQRCNNWIPPYYSRKDLTEYKPNIVKCINEKNIADSLEALVGAYFKSGGIVDAIYVMGKLRIIETGEWFRLIDSIYIQQIRFTNPQITEKSKLKDFVTISKSRSKKISDVEKSLNYKFKKPEILKQALTHKSKEGPNYEDLEFLGDAVLDFIVMNHL